MNRVNLIAPRNAGKAVRHEAEEAGGRLGRIVFGAFLAIACSGCINVQAPDEPIVIQLDINIRAEVLYRLAEDAANTIDENADIF